MSRDDRRTGQTIGDRRVVGLHEDLPVEQDEHGKPLRRQPVVGQDSSARR